jgi:hypothetical protein
MPLGGPPPDPRQAKARQADFERLAERNEQLESLRAEDGVYERPRKMRAVIHRVVQRLRSR